MDGFVLSSENSHKGIKKCLPMNYQIYPLNVLIMVKTYVQSNNDREDNQTMKIQKLSLFNPFTGKRRKFADDYIPSDTLHELNFALANTGELLFSVHTDLLQT